jgi:hypothetical protein
MCVRIEITHFDTSGGACRQVADGGYDAGVGVEACLLWHGASRCCLRFAERVVPPSFVKAETVMQWNNGHHSPFGFETVAQFTRSTSPFLLSRSEGLLFVQHCFCLLLSRPMGTPLPLISLAPVAVRGFCMPRSPVPAGEQSRGLARYVFNGWVSRIQRPVVVCRGRFRPASPTPRLNLMEMQSSRSV